MSSLQPTPWLVVRQVASRERNIYITLSSVLHCVCASQTLPSDETATMRLTLCPIVFSGIELPSFRQFQHLRLKSVYATHDSSMLITCRPSLSIWSIFRA